ncbi:MAG: hypothetical protein ABI609_01775 [Acidobacteriota bacterium]
MSCRRRLLLASIVGLGARLCVAQVTLPLERYEDLRSRSRPLDVTPEPPPAPYAVESVELELHAGETSARLISTWRLAVFTPEWQSVPFLPSGSLVSADFGGLEGRVDAGPDGTRGAWSLRVRGTGRHVVRLESMVPLERDETATRPTWHLEIQSPSAAAVHGTLTALAAVEDVTSDSGALVTALRASASAPLHAGEWEFLAHPGTRIRLTLAGKATAPARAHLPLRMEASAATVATVSRTELKLRAWIETRVAQGSLEELRVPLPDGFEVASVVGAYSGWKTADKTLVVTPLAPIETTWPLVIELRGSPRNTFTSPLLLPAGVARVRAFCATEVKGDGLAAVADPGSARRVDELELQRLPADLRAGGARFYVVPETSRPPKFEVAWAEGTQVLAAEIDRLLVEVAVGEAGKASYRVWVVVRNRGAQQMVFEMPPGFELAAAARDQAQVRAGQRATQFTMPISAGERPQVLRLAGLLPLVVPAVGEFVVPMPVLSAPVGRVEVRALLPAGRSYTLADATRLGAVGAPPSSAHGQSRAENVAQQAVLAAVRALPADAPFGLPDGSIEIDAAWNALSPSPQPLVLRIKSSKERTSWF